MNHSVRCAESADAQAAMQLVRRSIIELCVDDHQGDEATLAAWLANKTEANFRSWIVSDRHLTIVAESALGLIGFGLLNLSGTIALLYVSPDAQYQDASSALLRRFEREALEIGLVELSLESTHTAAKFYQRRGYRPTGEPLRGFGITHRYPMAKPLGSLMQVELSVENRSGRFYSASSQSRTVGLICRCVRASSA